MLVSICHALRDCPNDEEFGCKTIYYRIRERKTHVDISVAFLLICVSRTWQTHAQITIHSELTSCDYRVHDEKRHQHQKHQSRLLKHLRQSSNLHSSSNRQIARSKAMRANCLHISISNLSLPSTTRLLISVSARRALLLVVPQGTLVCTLDRHQGGILPQVKVSILKCHLVRSIQTKCQLALRAKYHVKMGPTVRLPCLVHRAAINSATLAHSANRLLLSNKLRPLSSRAQQQQRRLLQSAKRGRLHLQNPNLM